MRKLTFIPVLALPLALGGCPAGTIGAAALGVVAPPLLELGTSYGEDAQDTVDAAIQFRREQIERRRDWRVRCQDDILAMRQAYLMKAAQLSATDPEQAALWYGKARQVLAQHYPSLTELSALGERSQGLCGEAEAAPEEETASVDPSNE